MEKRREPFWLARNKQPLAAHKSAAGLALLLIFLLIAAAGCKSQPNLVAQQFVQAVNDHDLNRAVGLFTPDAVVAIGDAVSFSGRSEIEHWLQGLLDDQLSLDMPNLLVRDDEVSSGYTLTLDSAGGRVASVSGTGVMTIKAGAITGLHLTMNDESQTELLKTKLTGGFYISELNAEPMMVDADGTTTLSWSTNAPATFSIRYSDRIGEHTQLVLGTPPYQYLVPRLQETTTFYLTARSAEGEKNVTVEREQTVKVKRPRLAYTVLADPSPLRVSTPSQRSEGSLTILVANRTSQTVKVKSIVFNLPTGSEAQHLVLDPAGIHGYGLKAGWAIRNGGNGDLDLTPVDSGQLKAGESLSFTLPNIPVNYQPGSCDLGIIEEIEDAPGKSSRGSATIQLAKLPAKFFVGDLNAQPLIINAGGKTTLSWTGSREATYTIRYWDGTGEKSEIVPGGPTYQYPVTNLRQTTTFYLIADAAEGEGTVTVQRERTVTVK